MDQQSWNGNLQSLPEARWKENKKPTSQSEDNFYHNFFRPKVETKKKQKVRDPSKGILTDVAGFELSSAAAPPRPPKGQGISIIENPPLRPPKIGLDFSSPAVEAAFRPFEAAVHPKPAPAVSTGVGKRCILVLSALLALCFLISLVFGSLALANNFRLSEELKMLQMENSATRRNVSTGLENSKKDWDKIKKDLADVQNTVSTGLENSKKDWDKIKKDLADVQNMALKNLEDFKTDQGKYRSDTEQKIQELMKNLGSICGTCPEGWKWFQKSCYFFSSTTDTWKSAGQFCLAHGSHLAIIKDQSVQSYVVTNANWREHWIGLSDSGQEHDWRWVDGTSPTYLIVDYFCFINIQTKCFWAPREPNNLNEEDCGSLSNNGKWNDLSCGTKCHWICQKHWVC